MSSVLAAPRPRRLELSTVLCSLVLAAVALCVVFPLVLVALQSLQVAPPGQPARYGLDGIPLIIDFVERGQRGRARAA